MPSSFFALIQETAVIALLYHRFIVVMHRRANCAVGLSIYVFSNLYGK